MMNVYVYGDPAHSIVRRTIALVKRDFHTLCAAPAEADVALAPLLRRKLSAEELAGPRLGTLIFHPSLLPRHRGPDAIKWAFASGAAYTGATWFWANGQYDAGDLCEQCVLEIVPGETPRAFYERAVVPSALLMLRYILGDLARGHVRCRPQREEAATYEGRFPRSALAHIKG